MASSSDTPEHRFAQRLQQHERVPRVGLDTPAPQAAGRGAQQPSHARFIPREELGPAVAWVPRPLDGHGGRAAPTATPPPADPAAARAARQAQLQARLAEVFEQGRQQGRDEMAETLHAQTRDALEALRQQQAVEVGAPVAAVLAAFQQGLDGIEQSLARRLAGIALQMARQVVRSELQTRATLVVEVVQEALGEVLLSARHITVKVHPDDLASIEQGCRDAVEARGARLIADHHLARGGCLVESDLGVVDARLATRWASAVAAMGSPAWVDADGLDDLRAP
jgi:flagellar assembly protein FliH